MLAIISVFFVLLMCCQEGLVSYIDGYGFDTPLNGFHLTQAIPQAIIHIGPHKAASTYIQSELVSLTKELANANYFWPTRKDGSLMGTKEISSFAFAVRGLLPAPEPVMSTMGSFLQHSLRNNHNIIMSSEEFDDANATHVATLKNHLQGFNVTIVFVYRELLAQLISLHFETNRFEHEDFVKFSTSFSGFLFRMLDTIPQMLKPAEAVKIYADVFGVERMRVIDLLGVAAAREDVVHVLLCKIGGVLCHYKGFPQLNTNTGTPVHLSNSAYSLLPAQVFSFYKSYLERQHNNTCRICGSVLQEYHRFTARYKEHLKVHAPPAITTTKLSFLVPLSQQADATLRDTYGSAILYSNRTANLQAMSKVQVFEIDPEFFMMDVYWNEWIHLEYETARADKKLCGCKV